MGYGKLVGANGDKPVKVFIYEKMVDFLKRHVWTLLGLTFGALAGYLYWKHVGCVSGTCPITAQPLNSTAYGAILGGILLSNLKK